MKKILTLVLTFAVLALSMPAVFAQEPNDVQGEWTKGNITAVAGPTFYMVFDAQAARGHVYYTNSNDQSFEGETSCYLQEGNKAVFAGVVSGGTAPYNPGNFRVEVQDNGETGDVLRVVAGTTVPNSCFFSGSFPGRVTEGNIVVHELTENAQQQQAYQGPSQNGELNLNQEPNAEKNAYTDYAEQTLLQPGWDSKPPLESGNVTYKVMGDTEALEITYTVNDSVPGQNLKVGLYDITETNLDSNMFDDNEFGLGWGGGTYTREGVTVSEEWWNLGYLITEEDGDGSITFTVNPNPGDYDVQFFIWAPSGYSGVGYESGGIFGTTVPISIH